MNSTISSMVILALLHLSAGRDFSGCNLISVQESPQRAMRTIDVARRSGYSVQQIRNLVSAGVLPAAERTARGYRRFTGTHVDAACAYRELVRAVDSVAARRIMCLVVSGQHPQALAAIDHAHAGLHTDRERLALARRAAEHIADEPMDPPLPSDTLTIGDLASALGVRTSTLRHWEHEGLLAAERSESRVRRYPPTAVRDARLIHQLRAAGYRVDDLRQVLPIMRESGGHSVAILDARDCDLADRSMHLLRAGGRLADLIIALGTDPPLPTGDWNRDTVRELLAGPADIRWEADREALDHRVLDPWARET